MAHPMALLLLNLMNYVDVGSVYDPVQHCEGLTERQCSIYSRFRSELRSNTNLTPRTHNWPLMLLVAIEPHSIIQLCPEGRVDAKFDIDQTGVTTNINITYADNEDVARDAFRTLSHWKFTPSKRNGKAQVSIDHKATFTCDGSGTRVEWTPT